MTVGRCSGRTGRLWLIVKASFFQPFFQRWYDAIGPSLTVLPARQAAVQRVDVRALDFEFSEGARLVGPALLRVARPELQEVGRIARILGRLLVRVRARRRVLLCFCYRYRYRFWYRYRSGTEYRYCVGTMLAWCRYGAGRFSHVRGLVFQEVDDLHIPFAIGGIPRDEAGARERVKHGVYVAFVEREHVNFYLHRLINQATIAICQAPEASEQMPS